MSSQVTLNAERRDATGKGSARKLRARGKLPAVVYGGEGEAMLITLNAHDCLHLFQSISVDNTIVNLDVEGVKIPVPTLVREIQAHPYKPDLVHVDFYRIQKGVEVELDVPIHLIGTPTGVKDQGGVLEHTIHSMPVRCIPAAIPDVFELDVSGLEINDSLHVGQLDVPEGVTMLLDPERTICSVQPPSVTAAPEDEEAVDEEPEVIGEEPEAEDDETASAE
jgi:large subunit ribosomal protein L25